MRYATGMMLVILAGILWSLQGLIFRQIEDAGPWPTLFWRSVGMLPVLLAFLVWRGGGSPLPAIRQMGWAGVTGGLGLVLAFGGAIFAIQITTIANAVFLFTLSPFFTALLGRAFLGEGVRLETWAAMGVAMLGVFVMVRDGLGGAGVQAGSLAALVSAVGFAVFTVSLRWRRVEDSLPAVLMGGVFAMLAGAAAAAGFGQTLAVAPADALWAMFMGAVTLTGGMVLYTLGSRVVPSAETALLSNIEVLLAPFWVWLFLGETASAGTLAGGAILLAAVTLNGISGARRGLRA